MQAAVEFLLRWSEAPWTLTAISPAKEGIQTKSFRDAQLMEKWIEERRDRFNLYFTINKTFQEMDIKPGRKDVAEIRALHLDIDPRVGEDPEEEKVRILKAVRAFKPYPSIIVDSGAGIQCYWLLEEPIILDGQETTAIDAESYIVQLELLLGADKCSNCDRVMRLPGTMNLPNEVKLKKGRKACAAQLLEWEDTKYPLSIFTKAPIKIQGGLEREKLPGGGEKIKLSGNIEPLYVDNLPEKNIKIDDSIKMLIIHGEAMDKKYPSRSEALFAVCCALVKAEASDEVIAGIIMNRENKISASVLDKPRPERYAAKQIQSAREYTSEPKLYELNSKHAVLSDLGGRCRIISEAYDHGMKRPRISFSTFPDFINRYLNQKIQIAVDKEGKPVTKEAGKWWIGHPQRRQYETITFAPGREIPDTYNLWLGWACEALPGDCSLFLKHIEDNLCKGNKEHIDYLMGWMARCVQQPDCPGEVAVVLRGEMGVGKSLFAKLFGSLFGRHFLQVSDPKHLVGSFNSHLRDCVLLFGDESFWAGDKKHESVLKSLITEESLTIEQKGVDVFSSPNYTHLILASNSSWIVPAGSNERRFFVLEVGRDKMQNKIYFKAIQDQMNNGGREGLLHFLLSYDISNFEVRDVPKTGALQEQKMLSMGPEETWWYEKLEEGRILQDDDNWAKEVQKIELQNDYIMFMQRSGILRKASPTVLGKFLGRVCPGGVPKSYQKMAKVRQFGSVGEEYSVTRRTYFYALPDLGACRAHWDTHHGGPFKWNDALDKGEQIKAEEEAFK